MANPDSASAAQTPAVRRAYPRHLWPVLLVLLGGAFIAFAVSPYLSLDAAQSRIPPPPGNATYYGWLVSHVFFASFAMLTASFQVWTGLKQLYPKVHRLIGRLYVFGGVLPAAVSGYVIASAAPFGLTLMISDLLLATIWLVCTIAGFTMGRLGRYQEHRRWMTRSVVLTFSIITNRIWATVFFITLSPHLDTLFGGDQKLLVHTVAGLSGWLGWVLPLLITEWCFLNGVERPQVRPRPSPA